MEELFGGLFGISLVILAGIFFILIIKFIVTHITPSILVLSLVCGLSFLGYKLNGG